jgi:hypothetical protein
VKCILLVGFWCREKFEVGLVRSNIGGKMVLVVLRWDFE